MLKNKKIYLLLLLLIISTVLIVTGASFSTASITQDLRLGDEESVINNIKHFSDVSEKDWFFTDVQYVSSKKIMNGTSDTTFAPNDSTTRGMIVTILWRLEGEPDISAETSFLDVENNTYYYKAVAWATANKIVSGYNDTSFGPEDSITREQLAAILYRYALFKNYDVSANFDMSKFEDFGEISDYAVDAMTWACDNEIITGTTPNIISPKGNATRCQVAAILKRVCENVLNVKDDNSSEDKSTEDKSADIREDSVATDKPSSDTEGGGSSSGNTSSSNIGGGGSSSGSAPSLGAGSTNEDDENDTYEEIIEEQPTIKVNTSYGKPGDIIKVDLDLQKNPGILGMTLSLEYDETAMRLLGVENGDAVAEFLTLTPSKTLDSGAKFVWSGLDLNAEDVQDGTLLTLEFELSEDATIGKRYPLKLSYTHGDVVDTNLNEVSPRIIQGFIEIEENN